MKNQPYAIMRFAKYKGPEISRIESHDERTKEKYASNPDIDPSRSHLNFHLITPKRRYRAEAEQQIKEAGCRTRTDSIRMVETIFTASHEFFKDKSIREIRAFFQEALDFLSKHQAQETMISAVVHMDERTPHMHLCFVPLTADKRLSAKDIIGNRKQLCRWQDLFWEHMSGKYPELERGESASETGRKHIPTSVYKQMSRLTRKRKRLEMLLSDTNVLNLKSRKQEISQALDSYLPDVWQMAATMKKYDAAFREAEALEAENEALLKELEAAKKGSVMEKLQQAKMRKDYQEAVALLERIPQEILNQLREEDRGVSKTITGSLNK
ncbi:MAG: plasmid recombination protein [Clostridia bacterium]|nr:plasmid recombination protein [Clostridia bacterium]